MASQEEFTALVDGINNGALQDRGKSRTRHGQRGRGSPTKSRPPQPPRPMEQTPLLAPVAPPMPPPPSQWRGHGRSRSDMAAPPQSAERVPHPFNKGILTPPLNRSFSSRPPRAASPMPMGPPPPPHSAPYESPLNDVVRSTFHGSGRAPPRRGMAHRRAKSDIPLAFIGGGSSRRDITKADLLKSLPAPRWGGAAPNNNALTHTRRRSRTNSDGIFGDGDSVRSGGGVSLSGYGAFDTLSEHGHPLRDGLPPRRVPSASSMGSGGMGRRVPSSRHLRKMSDASVRSVTTDLSKSALFKGVTSTGRIQLQLPKDSFRLLMDSSLETGHVYKRKLVDDEGEYFLEFYTVDNDPDSTEEQKRLPPDHYVMAVDSSIYRRMLDEVIRSRSMPCGTFFCGHHEDVRHPDITIAALVVAAVIFLLLAGSMSFS